MCYDSSIEVHFFGTYGFYESGLCSFGIPSVCTCVRMVRSVLWHSEFIKSIKPAAETLYSRVSILAALYHYAMLWYVQHDQANDDRVLDRFFER